MATENILRLLETIDTHVTPEPENWKSWTARIGREHLKALLEKHESSPSLVKRIASRMSEKLQKSEDRLDAIYRVICSVVEEFAPECSDIGTIEEDFMVGIASLHQDQARIAIDELDIERTSEIADIFFDWLEIQEPRIEVALERAIGRKNTEDINLLGDIGFAMPIPEVFEEPSLFDLLRDTLFLSIAGKFSCLSVFRTKPQLRQSIRDLLVSQRARAAGMSATTDRKLTPLLQRHREDWDSASALNIIQPKVQSEYEQMLNEVSSVITESPQQKIQKPLPHNPLKMYSALRKMVVSQSKPLKTVAVVCFEHFLRSENLIRLENPKPTVMMFVGPSGSGKTHIARTACKFLGLPFSHVNAASLVGSGIVGTGLSDALHRLTTIAEGNVEIAESGVLFIDEIDKLDNDGNETGLHFAKSIQSELLMFLEGEHVYISRDRLGENKAYYFDTSKLLVMFGGAFDGIEDIVRNRLAPAQTIGFSEGNRTTATTEESLYAQVTKADIIQFGFMPQLLGRIQVITSLSPITKGDLLEILNSDRISPLHVHRQYFDAVGDELTVDEDALELIADAACNSGLGVRSLYDITNAILLDLKFVTANHRSETIHLSRDFVLKQIERLGIKVETPTV